MLMDIQIKQVKEYIRSTLRTEGKKGVKTARLFVKLLCDALLITVDTKRELLELISSEAC